MRGIHTTECPASAAGAHPEEAFEHLRTALALPNRSRRSQIECRAAGERRFGGRLSMEDRQKSAGRPKSTLMIYRAGPPQTCVKVRGFQMDILQKGDNNFEFFLKKISFITIHHLESDEILNSILMMTGYRNGVKTVFRAREKSIIRASLSKQSSHRERLERAVKSVRQKLKHSRETARFCQSLIQIRPVSRPFGSRSVGRPAGCTLFGFDKRAALDEQRIQRRTAWIPPIPQPSSDKVFQSLCN